ncbi:MAG: heavy metal translocating P-type ATPase [Bernardetiaceae bacterium]
MTKKKLPVRGMRCAACAVSVEKHLQKQTGVRSAAVNLANHSVQLELDEDIVSEEILDKTLAEIGFGIGQPDTQSISEQPRQERQKLIVATALTLPLFVVAMFVPPFPYDGWLMAALSLPVLAWSGQEFFVQAWRQALQGSSNMDTLVALGTGTAFVFSLFLVIFSPGDPVYFEGAAVVVTLVLLGRYMEQRARQRTSQALEELLNLQADTARVIRNGIETEVPLQEVWVGDRLRVLPGERVPVDGLVRKGETLVDESMLTGEPLPVHKQPRSAVIGGTINRSGSFEMIAQKVGEETFLYRMVALVEEAQGKKPPIQRLVDRISSVFVPIVMGLALLSFLYWWGWIGLPLGEALSISVSILVVACPCALGLATPTAIMVGMGQLAKAGILVRDAEALEGLERSQVIVFDKTGTLTEGKPQVKHWRWMPAAHGREDELQQLVWNAERESDHPLAKAIVAFLPEGQKFDIQGFEDVPGYGIRFIHHQTNYRLGNAAFLKDLAPADAPDHLTYIYLADAQDCLLEIALWDAPKTDVAQLISRLQAQGLETQLLSGDRPESVRYIAQQLGITQAHGGVLPEDKLAYIQKLQAEGKKVAMIGDGINDAPALAQADIGIAMGSGTDIAMESASVTLLGGNLSLLPRAMDLARATNRVIRQNLFWAFAYNVLALPVAAGVLYPFLLNPMIAGAAMAMSSVSVVLSSLRLLRA